MTKIDNPSHWKPGQTGNPLGRPKGTRNQFSAAFIGDMQASWAQHGANVLEIVARKDPSRYLGIASSLIPKDVALSIEARQVGGLDPRDLEILRAIKLALPTANDQQPGEVLNYVLDAIRAHSAKTIESE
jgi:Family of unknown function (DUF5681)